jgi:phage/plasmid primase-like uncharacterized protein
VISAKQATENITILDILHKYGYEPNGKRRIPCPIHNGKNNNFSFTDKKFYCFKCHAKGDVIDLVTQLYNLNFKDALRKIAIDFGLSDTRYTYRDKMKQRESERERERQNQIKQSADELYMKLSALHRELYVLYGEQSGQVQYIADVLDQAISDTKILFEYRVDWENMMINLKLCAGGYQHEQIPTV